MGKVLGASVIAAASTQEKREAALAQGADHAIDYADGAFREHVKALTGGRGADVIFDPVGGDVFDESLHCIAPFGRLLVIGFAGGRIASVPSNYALLKQISIVGVRAGEYGRLDPEGGRGVNDAILELAAAGKLHPRVAAELPFDGVIRAFDAMRGRGIVGRLVVRT
jgi:NADPH2:quinone reductase